MGCGCRKKMKGGSEYGEGTEPPQTQGYGNGATNSQEDAANASNADGDKLNELNQLQNGGKGKRIRHYQYGGNTGQLKVIQVDSPARETAAGAYTTENQIKENQIAANQGMANTKFDNPGSQSGGKRRRNRTRYQTKRKSKKGNKKTVKKYRTRKYRKHH